MNKCLCRLERQKLAVPISATNFSELGGALDKMEWIKILRENLRTLRHSVIEGSFFFSTPGCRLLFLLHSVRMTKKRQSMFVLSVLPENMRSKVCSTVRLLTIKTQVTNQTEH